MTVLSSLRVLQLASANLPVGGFTYSQGLEWAVEANWITNYQQTNDWLAMQMNSLLYYCDLPILDRLYQSCLIKDKNSFESWTRRLLRQRESHELRLEERQRGQAFWRFIDGLGLSCEWAATIQRSQLAGLAWYGAHKKLSLLEIQTCWGYSWIESNVMAAIKLVPLGQQSGQQLIYDLSVVLSSLINQVNQLDDDDIGASSPLVAIASSCHETQYTRLFRS